MQRLVIFIILLSTITLVIGCGRRRRRPSDHSPPTMNCPGDITAIADEIQVNTKVDWDTPKAIDNKDGTITPRRTGPRPGSIISETSGGTKVTYTATDRSGNYKSCGFRIFVNVIRCKKFGELSDGWKICHPSDDMRRGGTCQFGCYEGHRLRGNSSVRCQDDGQWDNEEQPYCEKLTCPSNEVIPADQHTTITCTDENKFRSICTYSCQSGYDILPGLTRVKVCTKYGLWNGRSPECIDTEPPKFTNCPSVLKGYADRSRTSGSIHWNDPLVSDNSGSVSLRQTGGPKSEDDLEVGQYTVTYTAYDGENNTATCSFEVIIKQIMCPTIYPLPYTSVVCPNGRIFGSSCDFSCDNGTTITSNNDRVALCDKQGNVHHYGQWSFGNSQPYCTLTSLCPELTAPGNGALACDVWMDGDFCQTFCRKGYMFNTQEAYELYDTLLVCGDSGTWWAGAKVLKETSMPNCVPETRLLKRLYDISAIYHFDGPCESALEEIKEKFIEKFSSVRQCLRPGKCTVDNVEVTCGQSTDRKKRELNLQQLKLSAKMSVEPSVEEGATESIQHLVEIKEVLRNIDDPRLTFEIETVSDELECPPGFEPNHRTYTCAECPSGFYQDPETKVCEKCPFGYYQPLNQQTSCQRCPLGRSTAKQGADSEEQCEEACEPGHWSITGIKPCSPCDTGFYTTTYGTRECVQCPGDKITKLGATHEHECFDFDLEYQGNGHEAAQLISTLKTQLHGISIELWVHCTTCTNVLTISDSNKMVVSVSEDESLIITAMGKEFNHENVLSLTPLWKHIRISISDDSLTVRIDGEDIINDVITTQLQLSNGTEIHVDVGGSGFRGSVSHVNIWSDAGLDPAVTSPQCKTETTGDIVSWREFAELDGDFVQTRSKCDDFDNCQSGPCHNEGHCTDALDSYLCTCGPGFTGLSCETNIDECRDNICVNNATCVDRVAGYNCLCPKNFKGAFCEIQVVDGGWSDWENWGPCSVTCGTGKKTRTRTCSNPTHDNGGQTCEGESQDTAECETDEECLTDCEVDPEMGPHGHANCTATGTTRVCRPYCDKNYDFDTDMYLEAVCGLETGYVWNIKTEDNPTGQMPSCVEIKKAQVNTMLYQGTFNGYDAASLTKEKEAEIKRIADDKVAQTQCVRDNTCSHLKTEVSAYSSGEDGIVKRAVEYVSFVVTLSCDPVTGTDECYNLLKDVKETLDDFVRQLLFSVDVDTSRYYVDSNSTSIDGASTCDPGSAPVFYYCVPCGEGTYQLQDYCELCPRGTYQDDIGQTSCKECPEGWSTHGLMTRNVTLCTVPVDVPSDNLEAWMIVLAVLIPAVICCLAVAVLVIYCKWKQKKQRKQTRRERMDQYINVREPTCANAKFDKSRLFTVDHTTDYGCHYPPSLTVYPAFSSPPPVYETASPTPRQPLPEPRENQLKETGIFGKC